MESPLASWIPNKEGKELPQPLPIKTKSEIQKVKLYQMEGSPPCCAVRAFLTMADVAYETVNVDYVSKSELSFSEYKKVPVLTVNGYQINDSAIIIKTLTPIIYGRPLSQVEQAQVDETTTKTMLAFEVLMFQSDKDIQKYLAKFSTDDGCMSWIFKMVAPFVMRSIPGKIIDKHPDLQSFDQYGAAFKARLTGPTLGGAEPGPADAQLWGIVAIAKEAGMEFGEAWLAQHGLAAWYAAVAARMPRPIFA